MLFVKLIAAQEDLYCCLLKRLVCEAVFKPDRICDIRQAPPAVQMEESPQTVKCDTLLLLDCLFFFFFFTAVLTGLVLVIRCK